jgi:hypothetical protein
MIFYLKYSDILSSFLFACSFCDAFIEVYRGTKVQGCRTPVNGYLCPYRIGIYTHDRIGINTYDKMTGYDYQNVKPLICCFVADFEANHFIRCSQYYADHSEKSYLCIKIFQAYDKTDIG